MNVSKSFLYLLFLIFGCLIFNLGFAGVYRCVGPSGEIEFRDRGCEPNSTSQKFLPYVYNLTDEKVALEKSNAILNRQQKLKVLDKKQARIDARLKKTAEKEAGKKARRLMRCENTNKKIRLIQNELRVGCKLRRCNTLKKQLKHFELMKQRYCRSET